MSYSAEESSPLAHYETCCVCDEEFSSEGELTDHLIKHTDDVEFKESLIEFEQKKSAPSTPVSSATSSRSNSSSITPSKRSYNQRSTSPEVLVISDDSGDEGSKSKAPKLSNVRSVSNTNSTSNGQKLPIQKTSYLSNTAQGANNALQRRNVQPGTPIPRKDAKQGSVNQTQQNNVQRSNVPQNNVTRPYNMQKRSNVQSNNNMTPKSSTVQQPITSTQKSFNGTPQGTSKVQLPQSSSGSISKGPPHNCQICKKIFQDTNSYKEHLLTHAKKSFSCHICNKSFAFEPTLRDHLLKHVGDKSHECKKCHMKFSMKNILIRHEKICSGPSAKKVQK